MTELSQLNWNRTNLENIEKAWDGDLWDRERLGIQLTNYVDRLQCGAVLALDARWGEGKTWFVRHWQKHLEDEKHNVIYLDAFANDYLDDPFLTIASEISHAFKECDEIDSQDVEDFNSKTASVLISLAAILPVIAAKAGLHWVGLGGAGETVQELYRDGKEFYDSVSDEITAKVKEHIENKIENHQIEKESVRDFKNELAQLAEKLDKPLVFIIDELDRCRPEFAIRLIERIKHFFDISKIIFVLVMDKSQFSKVVCHNYGYDEKLGEEYLDKFIDFSINLPKVKNYEIDEANKYVGNIFLSLGLDNSDLYNGAIGLTTLLYLKSKITKRKLLKIINEFSLFTTFSTSDLNEFLIYILFNKELISNYEDDHEGFFNHIVKDLSEIVENYLWHYKYDMYEHMVREEGLELNEREQNEWCFLQYNSQLLKEMNYINEVDKQNPLDHVIMRSFKYNLDAGDSKIGLLESWGNYLNL
ncbi:KAP family P-loop NTPase fold protein [Acinetobacter venetianus]|uniref:KAP family P-loop NTPase fold protein n=1 Tax=Acinetobacter venetianus TaxID=52133 RepID=UPI00241CBF8F|nr:P-loop NTPase fold protein [Acinetobacter venetianus]